MRSGIISRVRERRPIVHCITNYVTANDCANILLACGASPIMSDDPREARDIASLAAAVSINLGTLSDRKLEAMLIAGETANRLGKPVILDPVGAGSSKHRSEAARKLLERVRFSVIRGNASEIRVLCGIGGETGGVDAAPGEADAFGARGLARGLAEKTGAVVAASGVTDIVTDGKRVYIIHNGHPMMSAVTGTGCQLSSLTAAFAAAADGDALDAAAAAAAAMGVAGEMAYKRLAPQDGSGSYRTYIIDAVWGMTPETLESEARYDLFS